MVETLDISKYKVGETVLVNNEEITITAINETTIEGINKDGKKTILHVDTDEIDTNNDNANMGNYDEVKKEEENEKTNNSFDTTNNSDTTVGIKNEAQAIYDSLPMSPIAIDSIAVDELCSTWKNIIDSIDFQPEVIQNYFKSLNDVGILVSYVPKICNTVATILSSINTLRYAISQYSIDQNQVDDDIKKQSNNYSYDTNLYVRGTRNPNSKSENHSSYNNISSGASNDTNTSVNNNFDLNINAATLVETQGVKFGKELFTTLYDFSKSNNIDLSKLLSDEKYSSIIKTELLKNQNLSNELKEAIMNLDPSILQIQIKNILNNSEKFVEINDIEFNVLRNYLSEVAETNKIPINELIKKDSSSTILKKALADFGEIYKYSNKYKNYSDSDVQKALLNIYDGDGISNIKEEEILILRNLVDEVSNSKNVAVETALTDESYASLLKNTVCSLGDISKYTKYLCSSNNNIITNVLTSIIEKK